jgi:hypothetical protein
MITSIVIGWIGFNVAFVAWRAVVAAGKPDVAPQLAVVRAKR